MKSILSLIVGVTFVVLATTASFANATAPQTGPAAHSGLSADSALILKLALLKDETKGN